MNRGKAFLPLPGEARKPCQHCQFELFVRLSSRNSQNLTHMALPPDYHMHTPLCRHASGEPVDYARRALEVGLMEIGFSDHSPMVRDDFDDWRMRNDQLDEYVEKVRKAQHDFPQLSIQLALEVDYLPGQEDWIRDLATRHSW